ncbi:hypothetical protein, partial [Helicobacter anatolicus]|uniref:hypothetical protein n=1 Tax=Helicobacter anatolicus TaxID=2905874 RepID=UPI001E405422
MRVNEKFKLFTPIAASSLVLILSGSMYGGDAIDPYYEMVEYTKAKDILIFQFSDGPYNVVVSGNQVISIIGKENNEITFKAASGYNSEMIVDFNGQSNKTFKLIAETSSFQGNLQVINYKPYPSNPNDTFNGTFNYGMIGNITTIGNAKSNFRISGRINNTSSSEQQTDILNNIISTHSFFAGNITTNGTNNNTNIVFENSIWLPSNLKELANNAKLEQNHTTIPEIQSGTLINSNGTTNIIFRTSSATLNNLGASMFNVINSENNGKVNIVVQGQFNVGANVSYANNTAGGTTFIFANSNDINGSTKDNFDNGSTDISDANSKVLG